MSSSSHPDPVILPSDWFYHHHPDNNNSHYHHGYCGDAIGDAIGAGINPDNLDVDANLNLDLSMSMGRWNRDMDVDINMDMGLQPPSGASVAAGPPQPVIPGDLQLELQPQQQRPPPQPELGPLQMALPHELDGRFNLDSSWMTTAAPGPISAATNGTDAGHGVLIGFDPATVSFPMTDPETTIPTGAPAAIAKCPPPQFFPSCLPHLSLGTVTGFEDQALIHAQAQAQASLATCLNDSDAVAGLHFTNGGVQTHAQQPVMPQFPPPPAPPPAAFVGPPPTTTPSNNIVPSNVPTITCSSAKSNSSRSSSSSTASGTTTAAKPNATTGTGTGTGTPTSASTTNNTISHHCPHPGCGRAFKDLKSHLLTHQRERPEKCPLVTCDYHYKGFSRKYDKNRHTLTHFRGSLVCGFCCFPGAGGENKDGGGGGSGGAASAPRERCFNRVDMFKRHLVREHDAEQSLVGGGDGSDGTGDGRIRVRRGGKRSPSRTAAAAAATAGYSNNNNNNSRSGKCSTCGNVFESVQLFYDHLDDCVLRVVQRIEPSEEITLRRLKEVESDEDVKQSLRRHRILTTLTPPTTAVSGVSGRRDNGRGRGRGRGSTTVRTATAGTKRSLSRMQQESGGGSGSGSGSSNDDDDDDNNDYDDDIHNNNNNNSNYDDGYYDQHELDDSDNNNNDSDVSCIEETQTPRLTPASSTCGRSPTPITPNPAARQFPSYSAYGPYPSSSSSFHLPKRAKSGKANNTANVNIINNNNNNNNDSGDSSISSSISLPSKPMKRRILLCYDGPRRLSKDEMLFHSTEPPSLSSSPSFSMADTPGTENGAAVDPSAALFFGHNAYTAQVNPTTAATSHIRVPYHPLNSDATSSSSSAAAAASSYITPLDMETLNRARAITGASSEEKGPFDYEGERMRRGKKTMIGRSRVAAEIARFIAQQESGLDIAGSSTPPLPPASSTAAVPATTTTVAAAAGECMI